MRKRKVFFRILYDLFRGKDQDEEEENGGSDGWGEFEGVGDFADILADAEEDGIRHLNTGDPGKYSHCNGAENCGDAWHVYNHRTEGRIHIKKKIWTFSGENLISIHPTGIQKGRNTSGAVYGLFAAENIIHPDASSGETGP